MARAILLAGLGWGDEGKGAITDFLCRVTGAHTIFRYNGGAQAAHNVCLADGRHHTFSQFGSGTFVPGVKTFLSRYMLVNPIALLSEGRHLQSIGVTDCFDRIHVDDRALVTNPFQIAANRIREIARDRARGGRHGSCGMGIGETVADAISSPLFIRVYDLHRADLLRICLQRSRERKMKQLCDLHDVDCNFLRGECTCPFSQEWDIIQDEGTIDFCIEKYQEFVNRVRTESMGDRYIDRIIADGTTIFEGAQGVLLDQDYGFHPYTTWTDITFRNAFDILGDSYSGEIKRVGVLRSYMTRHGAGPFPTEDTTLNYPESHNGNGPWQQGFRLGHFDLCLVRYALEAIGGVDEIALGHMDCIQGEQKICVGYNQPFSKDFTPVGMWEIRENLTLREEITEMLMKMSPVYRTLRYTPEGYATEISKLLGVKIGLKGYGPTADDRYLYDKW